MDNTTLFFNLLTIGVLILIFNIIIYAANYSRAWKIVSAFMLIPTFCVGATWLMYDIFRDPIQGAFTGYQDNFATLFTILAMWLGGTVIFGKAKLRKLEGTLNSLNYDDLSSMAWTFFSYTAISSLAILIIANAAPVTISVITNTYVQEFPLLDKIAAVSALVLLISSAMLIPFIRSIASFPIFFIFILPFRLVKHLDMEDHLERTFIFLGLIFSTIAVLLKQ